VSQFVEHIVVEPQCDKNDWLLTEIEAVIICWPETTICRVDCANYGTFVPEIHYVNVGLEKESGQRLPQLTQCHFSSDHTCHYC